MKTTLTRKAEVAGERCIQRGDVESAQVIKKLLLKITDLTNNPRKYRCYHCGAVFDEAGAAIHFGLNDEQPAICQQPGSNGEQHKPNIHR